MGKTVKINYVVDVIILLLFVLSAVSGLGLMHPQDARQTVTVVDASRQKISEMHIVTSFLMVAGVFVHFVLHWRWMSAMSKTLAQRRMPQGVVGQFNQKLITKGKYHYENLLDGSW